jgi:uncharacterized repeat protein (TIGR03803 family)
MKRRASLISLSIALVLAVSSSGLSQTYTNIYSLGSSSGDPQHPTYAGVIVQGRDGNLYSSTAFGGSAHGAIFKITPTGTLTVLHSFSTTEGYAAYSGVTMGADGNLYGTTLYGGTSNDGTIFKITPAGQLTTLHNFTGGTDGKNPYAPPVQGFDGNFYGTTSIGGSNGYGVVYKITASGTFTPLYQFDNTHGYYPTSALVQSTDGNLYGVTVLGGTSSHGTAFKITTAGKLTVLYNFGSSGSEPYGPLAHAPDGNFYGTTQVGGGPSNTGVIYKLTPGGAYTVLHEFSTDGANPYGGLVAATDNNLYGMSYSGGANGYGTLYKITAAGVFTKLHDFALADGASPAVTPMQHTNGTIFADTYSGGTAGAGVFFSLSGSFKAYAGLVTTAARVGTSIGILGQGLNGTTSVTFNGKPASFTISSDTFLTATVPSGATGGAVTVKTATGTLTSNVKFRVIPAIKSFTPTSGPVGTSVTITGTSFTGATRVAFGGIVSTSFTVNSDTNLTAVVPTGALTGKITITTPGGTATSTAAFTVTTTLE